MPFEVHETAEVPREPPVISRTSEGKSSKKSDEKSETKSEMKSEIKSERVSKVSQENKGSFIKSEKAKLKENEVTLYEQKHKTPKKSKRNDNKNKKNKTQEVKEKEVEIQDKRENKEKEANEKGQQKEQNQLVEETQKDPNENPITDSVKETPNVQSSEQSIVLLNKQSSKASETKKKRQKKYAKQSKVNSINSESFHESVQADEPKSSVPSTVVSKSPFEPLEEQNKSDPKIAPTSDSNCQRSETKPNLQSAPKPFDKPEIPDLSKAEENNQDAKASSQNHEEPISKPPNSLKSYIRQESSQASVASEPAHPHIRLSQSRNSVNENTEESKGDHADSKSEEASQTSSQKEESEGEHGEKRDENPHQNQYPSVNKPQYFHSGYHSKMKGQRKDMHKTSSYQNFKKEIREQKNRQKYGGLGRGYYPKGYKYANIRNDPYFSQQDYYKGGQDYYNRHNRSMKHNKYKEDRTTYKNPYYPKKPHYAYQKYDQQHSDDMYTGQDVQTHPKEDYFEDDDLTPNMTAPPIYLFSNDEEEKAYNQEEEEEKESHPKGFFEEEEIENEFNIFSAFQNPKQEFNLFAPSSDYFKDPSIKFDHEEEPAKDYNDDLLQQPHFLRNNRRQPNDDDDEVFIRFDNLEELREESEHYNYDIANKDISTKLL